MRFVAGLAVVAAVLAVVVCGCGQQSKTKYVIGMSQCNRGEPWRVAMDQDIATAAKAHPDVRVVFKDAQNNTSTQQAQVKELVDLGVDLIIISPKETGPLAKVVGEAMDKGIPVIVLDRQLGGDKYTTFIGGDNTVIGEEAGKYMVKLLHGKGNIVELKGLTTTQPAAERHNGFMKGIKGSQIKIIFSADCRWLEGDAQREMASALTRFPGAKDIDAVYGHNDPSAHGAYTAAKNEGKGREKTIKFVGIDGLQSEGVRYVREGILSATFYYPTLGKEAVDTALKILKGEKVPKQIRLGTHLISKETLGKS